MSQRVTQNSSEASNSLRIRPYGYMRVSMVMSAVILFGALCVVGAASMWSDTPSQGVLPALMICAMGLGMYRWFRVAVFTTGEDLVVRNLWSTATFRRDQIEGFEVGPYKTPFHKIVYVMEHGERAERLYVTLRSAMGGKRSQEQRLTELRGWLHLVEEKHS